MASDGEDFDDLEALRQAALASVKSRAKTESPQLESSHSSVKADEDEDLSALREAALRSTKVHSALVTKDEPAVDLDPHPTPQPRRPHHQRHPQQHSRQRPPYDATQKNGNWRKYHYSRNRANNLIVVPLALQGGNAKAGEYKLHRSQESGNHLELSDNKNLLLPQDKWAGVQPSASEDISSSADGDPKKRKDGKFSRYDDSESDEDSVSDSDMLSLSSESHFNKDMCSDSDHSVSNQTDTRIVKCEESKDIVIQKAVSDNSELEATVDSLEIQDKVSSDSLLLEDFDEPLLDIQENGEIDDTTNAMMNTSDKQVTDEAFSVDLVPSESLDMEESESAGKEVLEARKKKFESTEEIKASDLRKTISLKGIVPKSRKRHRQQQHPHHHQENKLSHSSHKEELHSRDLKERNCDEVEDLRMKTTRSKDYHRHHNRYSSGSSRSSDDSCHSGSFSDSAGQPIQLKDHPYYHLGTGMSTSNRFNQPMPPYGENQRRVVHERPPHQNSSKHTRYHLSDLSDSGEDNENSLFKKRSLPSVVNTSPDPKRHKSCKVLDSDRHSDCQKEPYSSDSKTKHSSQPRGWAALMESRSKVWLTSKNESDYHGNCDTLELEEQIEKSPRISFTFEHADEVYPAKKVDDRLSVHQRLGLTSKTKLEISEPSTEKQQEKSREKKKNKSSDPSKETELDQKILRIQEMNAAILKRQAEVKKDKERYG